MGFNLIYWTPICGKNFLDCSILEKCGKIWKNSRFSGRLRPDRGHTARAATAGLGSKGLILLKLNSVKCMLYINRPLYTGLHLLY